MKTFLLLVLGAFILSGYAQEPVTSSSEVRLETMTGALHGTLLVPEAESPITVALILPGSGPTDRNGNGPLVQTDAYKLLAEALAENGVASLRIDKRGVGESAAALPNEADIRFNTYISDAVGWLAQLREDPRFGEVAVIGHSEGALVGLLAAKQADADLYVSLAGAGERASNTLRTQLSAQLPDALMQEVDTVLSRLEAGQTVDPLPENIAGVPGVANLFRPSVQPYLISWFKYDPAREIASLEVPTLIIQGTTDIQVSAKDAQKLKAAKPDAELVMVEEMNHVLKAAPIERSANLATYNDPSLPLADGLIGPLITFLEEVD